MFQENFYSKKSSFVFQKLICLKNIFQKNVHRKFSEKNSKNAKTIFLFKKNPSFRNNFKTIFLSEKFSFRPAWKKISKKISEIFLFKKVQKQIPKMF